MAMNKKFIKSLYWLTLIGLPSLVAAASGCNDDEVAVGVPLFTGGSHPGWRKLEGSTITCVSNSAEGGAILVYVKALLQYLSGMIGLVIVLMIIIAGIQYVTAFGDPKRIAAAKSRLTNALIGLFLFIFAFAILSFIIPGGVLG